MLAWLALRLGSAWLANGWLLRDRALNRYLFLAPARDLLSFAMWFASFFYRRTTWRGDRIHLENGRMRAG